MTSEWIIWAGVWTQLTHGYKFDICGQFQLFWMLILPVPWVKILSLLTEFSHSSSNFLYHFCYKTSFSVSVQSQSFIVTFTRVVLKLEYSRITTLKSLNIRRTKSQNFNDSRLVLQLPLPNPYWIWRMKRPLSSMRNDLNYLCHLNVEKL